MRCAGGNVEDDYGYLEIRLDGLLKEKGLSKNKLSHKAEMNWKQIDNYCTNSITRACLKIHSRHPYAPLCGRSAPYSVAVARYSALMRNKSPTNCDARLT